MQIGVGVKFGFWLSLLGVVAIASTAYYIQSEVRVMLFGAAKQRLVTATTVLGRRFTVALDEAARDVALMSRLDEVEELARGPGDGESMQSRLANIFSAALELHPEYLQLRLIGADDFGRELVRVDRFDEGTARVAGSELQEKGHFPYVYRTLAQPPGSFYLSQINLNLERGVRFGLNWPTLRLATPVYAASGRVFGLVIVNVALNGLFNQLRADLPEEMDLFLTNDQGDYLIHPDPTKTFGFDRGRRSRIQDDFEAAAGVLERRYDSIVLEGDEQVSAFVDVPFGAIAPDRRVVLGLAIPNRTALLGLATLAERLIFLVSAFSVLAIFVSFILSKLLVRPLDRVVAAVNGFSSGSPLGELPSARNDEIGVLSRSFASMATQIGAQIKDLQLSERNLHRILETAPSGMIIAARDDHRPLFMNTSAKERFQHTSVQGTFHPIDDGLDPKEAEDLYCELERTGKVEYAEHRLQIGHGDELWALLSMDSIEYQGEGAVLISIVDITGRKEAEIELTRYRNELEALVEERTAELHAAQREALRNERLAAIGQITGTVSHELRNPLGTIHSSFALLRNLINDDDPRVMNAIERIDRNISRCDKIIQELLDYTRMRDLTPQPTDLDHWLGRLLDEQELPDSIQVVLSLKSSITLPIDRERMAQAVINVMQNACEAMSDADPTLVHATLKVSTRTFDDRVEIVVEDTGPGIDSEDQAKVFEPLFSTRPFGVGLGLPHVKQIMDLHRGGVEIDCRPGAGTRVTLWLPRLT